MRKCLLLPVVAITTTILLFDGCGSSHKATSSAPTATDKSHKREIEDKYATILGVDPTSITNYSLYSFIDEWYGAPYLYGGQTKNGVDCSDFAIILYKNVYGVNMSGSAAELYAQCESVKVADLKEGDLIFFKINSKKISHMGVYLQNNKFVHASVHSGVVIDDLNENYYKKYYYKAGRLLKI